MGPNARKKPKLGREIPTPMTHEDVDKLLRPSRKSAWEHREQQEEWIIKTQFPLGGTWWSPGGGIAYWGKWRDGSSGLTSYRTNATRYESKNTALYEAYSYKEAHLISEFEVEQLPAKSRLKGSSGTGGRV
jgi:hypothetical protein